MFQVQVLIFNYLKFTFEPLRNYLNKTHLESLIPFCSSCDQGIPLKTKDEQNAR